MNTTPSMLASVKAVLASLLEVGQTRLQLASTEIEQERLRLAELVLWATFALFLLGAGLIFSAMLLVLLFWDGPREWVLGAITALFVGTGAWAGMVWRRKARDKPPFLAATIDELKRDRAALGREAP